MNPDTLALLRNLALILLCLEMAVMVAVPGVILYFGWKYLHRFRLWLHLPLLRVQVMFLRVEHITINASNRVAMVPIRFQMIGSRVRTTARNLVPRS